MLTLKIRSQAFTVWLLISYTHLTQNVPHIASIQIYFQVHLLDSAYHQLSNLPPIIPLFIRSSSSCLLRISPKTMFVCSPSPGAARFGPRANTNGVFNPT